MTLFSLDKIGVVSWAGFSELETAMSEQAKSRRYKINRRSDDDNLRKLRAFSSEEGDSCTASDI
jgi:hypothetical protein